jgi:hypothetical protein
MKRVLIPALLAALLVLLAAAPAAAHPRTEVSDVVETFFDVDPCTGVVHEVTLSVTFLVHTHGGVVVARGVRTLTTSSGYVGGGTSSFIDNGQVEMFRFNDLLADGSGNRIRATGVFVTDLSSGTLRVDAFELTCLGS